MDEFDQEDFADEFEMQFSEELEMMKEVGMCIPYLSFLGSVVTNNIP